VAIPTEGVDDDAEGDDECDVAAPTVPAPEPQPTDGSDDENVEEDECDSVIPSSVVAVPTTATTVNAANSTTTPVRPTGRFNGKGRGPRRSRQERRQF
jgi:hypothetical protein